MCNGWAGQNNDWTVRALKKRRFVFLFCLLWFGFSFAGLAAAEPSKGGEIVVGTDQNTTTMDPAMYQDAASSQTMINVYETLVIYDAEYKEIVPYLAESWSHTDDLREWTFRLRKGVRFHKTENQPGREMTAEDVKYSFERTLKISPMKRLFMLDHVEVVDPYTAKLVLNQPFAALLAVLTDVGSAVIPKEDAEKWGADFSQHPVGTGPYRMTEWVKDSHMTFERYDDYWNREWLPHPLKVTYRYIVNKTAMTTALLSGQVHITREVLDQDVKKISDSAGHRVVKGAPCNVYAFYMNATRGPTTDPKVRELFFRAVDVSQIAKALFPNGSGEAAYGPIPPGSWGYNPDVRSFYTAYDPARAKELLAELGKKPGELKLRITTSEDERRKKAAIIAQAMLKKVGVEVEVQSLEWGSFMGVASKAEADIYAIGWTWYPDPFFYVYYMFHSEKKGSYGNGGAYNNPEVDKLIDLGASVGDQQARTGHYRKAEELIMGDRYYFPLYHMYAMNGVDNRIADFHPTPQGSVRLFGPDFSSYLNPDS